MAYTESVRAKPVEVFPPGEFIREEMEARGWTTGELAERMGMAPWEVSFLLLSTAPITVEIAKKLRDAFGTSATLWCRLQASWDEFQRRVEQG